jgi:predicted RNA binding protein YcfA (HicA-like mRNA interferase family)
MNMKVRDIVKLIEADGWFKVSQEGSHSQYKHPSKKGRVTVPGQPGDDLRPGTLKSIYRQAQVKEKR